MRVIPALQPLDASVAVTCVAKTKIVVSRVGVRGHGVHPGAWQTPCPTSLLFVKAAAAVRLSTVMLAQQFADHPVRALQVGAHPADQSRRNVGDPTL